MQKKGTYRKTGAHQWRPPYYRWHSPILKLGIYSLSKESPEKKCSPLNAKEKESLLSVFCEEDVAKIEEDLCALQDRMASNHRSD